MSDQYKPDHMVESSAVSQFSPQSKNTDQRRAKMDANKRFNKKKRNKCSKKTYKEPIIQGYKSSLWKLSENAVYMEYLMENEQLFYASKFQRKNMKINVLMSIAVKTRSADQCRSHHQKMIKYHRDIPNIIKYIQSLLNKEQEGKKQLPSPLEEERPSESPQTVPPEVQTPPNDAILVPEFDWESWIDRNYLIEQQRLLELWLEGVQDKYGNLR